MGDTVRKIAGIVGIVALGFATFGIGSLVVGGASIGSAIGGGLAFGSAFSLSFSTLAAIGTLGLSIAATPSLEETGANSRGQPVVDPNALGVFAFGKTSVPLLVMYEEQHGDEPSRQVTNVFAHCWHRIESYESMYIGGPDGPEVVTFSGDAGTGQWSNVLWWFRADGSQTQSLQDTHGSPMDNNDWPSSAVGEGMAHSAIIWNADNSSFREKYSGVPNHIDIIVQGAWLYDPREDNEYGSGSHDYDDPSTWTYSSNAVLVLLRYLIGEYAGSSLIWGRGVSETDLDMDTFVAMADVADETQDGIPRFRLGGIHVLDGDFGNFASRWEEETGGKLYKSGGRYACWLPHDDLTALTTIADSDLLEGGAIEHTVADNIDKLYNAARGRYIEPDDGYRGRPYAEVTEADAITDDQGKRILAQDFGWIQDLSIAQRVARLRIRRSRLQRKWSLPMGWKAQGPNYKPFTVHTLNTKETGNEDQLCRVIERRSSYNGSTVLVVQQEDVSLYDDTIPLNDPLASNTIPKRVDQIGLITPRIIDRRDRQPSPYLDDPHFDLSTSGDESWWNQSSSASIIDGGGEGGSNALELECNGGTAFAYQERQFSFEGPTMVVTVRYQLVTFDGPGSPATLTTDYELFAAAYPFRSDPGGGKTQSPTASEVIGRLNYVDDLESDGSWATAQFTLDLSTQFDNGQFNLIQLRIGGGTNGVLTRSHTSRINSIGVRFT